MATKYQILRMETLGTPPLFKGGRPLTFKDPAEAAEQARYYSQYTGEKMCVKPVIDEEWRLREESRFEDGTYRVLPWYADRWWLSDPAYSVWKDHYAHASLEKPGWIAFTKNEEDGSKDKQTLLRPGAYLGRYFEKVMADYGTRERRLVEQFMKMYGPIDVKFASTEAEVVALYETLLTCMGGKQWPNGIHPATVYLAGDLQVAYIGDIAAGKVSARTIVWPDKKIHSRIYGDIARLTQGLNRLGYKWGAPIGAKLKRIQLNPIEFFPGRTPIGCFLLPYIDKQNQAGGGHLGVKDDGKNLVICADGEPGSHHAGMADGTSGRYVPRADEKPTFSCEHCEEEGVHKVYEVRIADPADGEETEMWCAECLADTVQCGYSGYNFDPENVEMVDVGGDYWAQYYAEMYANTCEGNGRLYPERDLIAVHVDGDEKVKNLSQNFITRHIPGGVFCSDLTGEWYPRSEMAILHLEGFGDTLECSKRDLTRTAFQCDGCGTYWEVRARRQLFGDDRLYCKNCGDRIAAGERTPVSESRKEFEALRDQPKLNLIAAE